MPDSARARAPSLPSSAGLRGRGGNRHTPRLPRTDAPQRRGCTTHAFPVLAGFPILPRNAVARIGRHTVALDASLTRFASYPVARVTRNTLPLHAGFPTRARNTVARIRRHALAVHTRLSGIARYARARVAIVRSRRPRAANQNQRSRA